MPPPITGPNGPHIPAPTFPTGPGGLLRPSDLSGQSLPQGPAGLTGQAPKFLTKSNSMPPRRNALPGMEATQQRNIQTRGGESDPPPTGYPYPGPPLGGNLPPLGEAALSAAQTSSNAAIESQNAMMEQMQQTNLRSIHQQMQMAEMESIKALASALAKTIKSSAKGVADLAS